MPKIKINGCEYHYEIHGSGDETIVFSHGLLWSSYVFHKQIKYFKDHYKVITYDHRGQGKSELTPGGYEIDELYEDAAQLLEKLNVGKVHFAGLSMGGFIALRLAARRPDLLKSLILMETSAQPESNKLKYNLLITIVKIFGIKSVTKPVMKIMFGENFINDPDRTQEVKEWVNELRKNKKTIVRAVSGVINRNGVEEELINIKCPTLILVGTQDKATIPLKAEFIHAKIPHSIIKYIQGGGHTSSIEEPEQCNGEIEKFLHQFS